MSSGPILLDDRPHTTDWKLLQRNILSWRCNVGVLHALLYGIILRN
jgi:hypothetical protein